MKFENQYLTYEEYRLLGGKMEYMPFNLLEFEVKKEIDNQTFGRLKNLKQQVQEVKMCIYKLINTINSYISSINVDTSNSVNKNIVSESVGSYSVTYADYTSMGTEYLNTKKQEVKDIIESYLGECKLEDGTPYLYRG